MIAPRNSSAAKPKFAQFCGELRCEVRVQKRQYKGRVSSVLIDSEVRTRTPQTLTNFGIGTLAMDFRNRHVIVTGGAGALGTAVVARLVEAGALCHVPCLNEAEAARFRLRDHKQVTVTVTGSLADEAGIEKLYRGIAPLWASIHTVGGFAAARLRDTELKTIRQQFEMNLLSCILCCRAAVRAMTGAGGRIVNVAARPGLEWRSGAGMTAYSASK